jgi:hypothetical protein
MLTSFPRIQLNLVRPLLTASGIRQTFHRFRLPIYCLLGSIFLHLFCMHLLKMFGSYEFGHAVNQQQAVMVDLASLPDSGAVTKPDSAEKHDDAPDGEQTDVASMAKMDDMAAPSEASKLPVPEPKPQSAEKPAVVPKEEPATPAPTKDSVAKTAAAVEAAVASGKTAAPVVQPTAVGPQAQSGGTMPAARYEKLNYALSVGGFMLGVTVGNAELESKNENGVTTISLRVKSNPVISAMFPVDDFIETQRVDQKYIISKIKQLEGNFKSDEMFTINMPRKHVAWMDFVRRRILQIDVPTDDVVDTLSGIYSLRTRKLEVGKTEVLHVYDAEVVGDVPVEIVRREEIRLPNLTKVKTLVVRPVQKTAGMFRRTGEVLIWMTDDEFKVPVKIVTTMALGRVTAELVSAETKAYNATGKEIRPGAPAQEKSGN